MNKQIGENMKKQISTLENIDIRSIWKMSLQTLLHG